MHEIPFDVLKRELIRLLEDAYSDICIAPIINNSNIMLMEAPLHESDAISEFSITPIGCANGKLPIIDWSKGREIPVMYSNTTKRNRKRKRKR